MSVTSQMKLYGAVPIPVSILVISSELSSNDVVNAPISTPALPIKVIIWTFHLIPLYIQ